MSRYKELLEKTYELLLAIPLEPHKLDASIRNLMKFRKEMNGIYDISKSYNTHQEDLLLNFTGICN